MPPELDPNAVEKTEATLLDLDTVEDMDFDSIEDPPGFVNPPDGVYDLRITKACIEKYKVKNPGPGESNERKRFAHYYTIERVVEIADSTEQEPKVGDKFSERFMMNEDGMKYWKGKAKAILGDVGKVSVSNVLAELSSGNYLVRARITNKKSKGKKGTPDENKEYNNTNVRIIGKPGEPGFEGESPKVETTGGIGGAVNPEA